MELVHSPKIVTASQNNSAYYDSQNITGPGDPSFGKRILCEGDSWMSIGAIPSSNLLSPLKFAQSTLLLNLATPGDTMKNMSDINSNPEFAKLICDNNFSYKWDAIFMSGGGNDLIDSIMQIICPPSTGAGQNFLDYIDRIELANFRKGLHNNFKTVSQLRDQSSKNKNTPLIVHVYDYPTPRNAKAKFLGAKFVGPWLLPALKTHDVPENFWISITDYVFEELGKALVDLESILPNFHVISATRGILTRARLGTTEADGDWLNEIHPTATGYSKLGVVISHEIQSILNQS